jgi:glutamate 5-kinase
MTDRSTAVIKIGTSSVTGSDGLPNATLLASLAQQIQNSASHIDVVVVSSGAVNAGWATIGKDQPRPTDSVVLQAVSAVGQQLLMRAWADAFAVQERVVGQVLLAPHDFENRSQYLHARQTLGQLLTLGIVPIINENDAVADDEIRYGDNDRLAALVAHLVGAQRLLILTDTPGLLTADPRHDANASLIEVVTEIDASLAARAGGPSSVGLGGMSSKVQAAWMATWSGVETVIASATAPDVVHRFLEGLDAGGTTFTARERSLSARKLWIAFAVAAAATLVVDEGAAAAMVADSSLLSVGISAVRGNALAGDPVEIVNEAGVLLAKGIVRFDVRDGHSVATSDGIVIHRDDLVILTSS